MLLKRKIGPKIVADWCGRGGGIDASWGRFQLSSVVDSNLQWIGFNFASKEATIALDPGHDQAAIGPRSRGNRASIVDVSLAIFSWKRAPRSWLCFHVKTSTIALRLRLDRAAIAAWSRHDRGLIAPRSWSSSTNSPRRPMGLQVSGRSRFTRSAIMRKIHRQPFDLWKSRWRSRPSDEATWRNKMPRSSSLKPTFAHVLDWWSRGLGSTRSPPSWCNPTPTARPRRLQKVRCVGHSPTRRKWWDKTQLNRGTQVSTNCVTAPLSYQGPTMPMGPPTTTPLTSVRVASCHASAPPAPRAGHPGFATWPQCRVAPSRWSRAPRQYL